MTDFDRLEYHREKLAAEERAEKLRLQIQEKQWELEGIPKASPPSPKALLIMILDLDERLRALEADND